MTAAPVVAAGRRRSELRRRRRRQRLRLLAGLLALAVLATGLVTWYFARSERPAPVVQPAAARTQRLLLLQLQGPDRAAVGSALLASDPAAARGAVVLVPPQVLAAPPGSGPLPFGQVLRTLPAEASRKALSDLLGVAVDAHWVLDLPAAARLVDGLGGVTVDVDVPVLGGAGGRTQLLSPGPQRVDGAGAVALGTFLASGEQEQARLARLQELLDGILAGLPPSGDQVAGLLGPLGSGSALSGVPIPGLADQLVLLARHSRESALRYDTLPVLPVDTGARTTSLRIDTARARQLVDRALLPSVLPGARAGGNRVKVFNGVGTPLLGDRVRDRLVAAGLVYVSGGNAASFGVARTEVQVGEATPEALELGRRVAEALGVPADAVRTSTPTSVADVVVVVGADFVPG